jgi:hypothetical protein
LLHVLVFDTINFLQEVAETVHNLLLFKRLQHVTAAFRTLLQPSTKTVAVANVLCTQTINILRKSSREHL